MATPRLPQVRDLVSMIGTQLATASYTGTTMQVVTDADAALSDATMPWIRLVAIQINGGITHKTNASTAAGDVANGKLYVTIYCPDAATTTDAFALEAAMDDVRDVMCYAELINDTHKHRVRVSTYQALVDFNPDESTKTRTGGLEFDLVITRDPA